MKAKIIVAALALATLPAMAQTGAVTPGTLDKLRASYRPTPADRAIHNVLNTADINTLAASADARNNLTDKMSHRVPSKGVTDQKSSGRCWLFTGLNVLRAQAIRQHNLPALKLSQAYNFFYDQLEKSNMFLQLATETASLPMDDRKVQWLFKNCLGDGGQFTGVADNLTKYGVVPAEVMPETYATEHTSQLSKLLGWKLKEWGLQLREASAKGAKPQKLDAMRQDMLSEVYRILALNFGVPPTTFTWQGKEYTPQSYYAQLMGNDLEHNYVMFMNDPTRPYYKVYEIDLDRHAYDGHNWRYLNVPMADIKKMAIASIKDSTAMYFSCDVGKYINKDNGTLDLENYDYGALLGTTFGMDKAQRISTGASGSTHAMTLVGVNLDAAGTPDKWLIENSWGEKGNKGHLVATDRWMDEYLFRLVVERRFVPKNLLDLYNQRPVMLPCWDPMY